MGLSPLEVFQMKSRIATNSLTAHRVYQSVTPNHTVSHLYHLHIKYINRNNAVSFSVMIIKRALCVVVGGLTT
jgi:hypothetical protein